MSEQAPDHAPELDVTQARQGRRGRHAFIILVCSTALVLIALGAVYMLNFAGLSGLHGNREAAPQVARETTTQPLPPKQTPDESPGPAAERPTAGG